MNRINFIADVLTEDPDGKSRVVIAVHPEHVIDAVVQASNKFADDTSYRDLRAKMMVNYNIIFQEFMESRKNSTIIITRLNHRPYALESWFDPKNDVVSDPSQIDEDKIVAFDAYRDLEDYLAEIRLKPNVFYFKENTTGDSCKSPKLVKMLRDADLIELVGGNLTGCLRGMLQNIEKLTNAEVRVVEAVTFDDDSKFWSRISQA